MLLLLLTSFEKISPSLLFLVLHSVLCGTVTAALTVAESPTFSPQLKSDKEKHAGLGHPSLLLLILISFENVGVLGGESGGKRINPETPSSSSEVVKKAAAHLLLLCCSVVMASSSDTVCRYYEGSNRLGRRGGGS